MVHKQKQKIETANDSPGLAIRDIRAEIQAALERYTQAAISRQSGISASALSSWLKGDYKGNLENIARLAAAWLDSLAERETLALVIKDADAGADEWVKTPLARDIFGALSYAQSAIDIALVYGGAGLGKTTTLRHYASTHPNVWIVTITPATARENAVLSGIWSALGLQEQTNWTEKVFNALVARLRGTNGLIIVDEAQHLGERTLETLRGLHDLAGVGLALVGNEVAYSRVTGGGRRADYLAQLYSRIGRKLHVSRATAADVAALCETWGVPAGAERDYLGKIAARPGALRGVVKTYRLARVAMAGSSGELELLPALKHAWGSLGGEGL